MAETAVLLTIAASTARSPETRAEGGTTSLSRSKEALAAVRSSREAGRSSTSPL